MIRRRRKRSRKRRVKANTARRWYFNQAQDGRCYLAFTPECQARDGRADGKLTWDHLLARTDGGETPGNVLLACSHCNVAKGRTPASADAFARAVTLWEEAAIWLGAMDALRELARLKLAIRSRSNTHHFL